MSKLFIPAEVMEKMMCLVCKKYLSVFPIHTKMDGSGGVCGRCPVPEPDKHVRDEAFENIAQFLMFPCTHAACKENMTPPHLERHESCCVHRQYECPSKSYSRCDWKGALSGAAGGDLKTHFQEKHPTLLLANPAFELSFASTIEENLLLCQFDELFIIKKEIDARRGLFLCTVEHLQSKENSDTYVYNLKCESGNKDYFYRGPEKPTKRNQSTQLTMDVLKERLHDPAAIIVNILIKKSDSENVEDNKKAEPLAGDSSTKNPLVHWNMLSELECPICLEYLLPPIFQCLRGHSICGPCKDRVLETDGDCPTCRQPFHETQNFALEKMAELLVYPCKYHKAGCEFAARAGDVRAHEDSCEHGPYECPLRGDGDCDWRDASSKVIEHVTNNHDEDILKISKMQMPFDKNETQEGVKLFFTFKKLFKITFQYDHKKFYWVVQLVGPAKDCKNYKYEVDVVDMSGEKKRFFLTGHVAPLGLKNLKTPGMYLVATLEQLQGFIKRDFHFRFKVIQN